MKPCTLYQETLLLDVHGELKPHERPAWEKHLEQCEQCRLEKERLLSLLGTVKATMSTPDREGEKVEGLPSSIRNAWRDELEGKTDRAPFWGIQLRLAPALAAACLVIALAGWFSFRELRHSDMVQQGSQVAMEELLASEDLEIVKNIELLEEMEEIEKLVELLDRPSYGDPSFQRRTKFQNGGAYV